MPGYPAPLETLFAPVIQGALKSIHPSWLPAVIAGLTAMNAVDPTYFHNLKEGGFLPSTGRLFAAFSLPLDQVKYVLVGEGPYPREESANGYCFMDGAVNNLWSSESHGGLSKKVNRATSLRNFIKMLLVADGQLDVNNTTGEAMAHVSALARQENSRFIQTLPELQKNMIAQGFLLLNASLVYRPEIAPMRDARAWQLFLQAVFAALQTNQNMSDDNVISLVLWGKIAEQLKQIPASNFFPHIIAEHPYNLSFIANTTMQEFFAPMKLLIKH
ncbi:MAG: uracil-DNA glycosylase [Pseudomonadota bacterium]